MKMTTHSCIASIIAATARAAGSCCATESKSGSSTSTPTSFPMAATPRSEERRVGSDWSSDVCSSDLYSVYYRGDGESRWKLLRYGIEERFVNLDADLFPDGGYTEIGRASRRE